jgi:hypothetical protein
MGDGADADGTVPMVANLGTVLGAFQNTRTPTTAKSAEPIKLHRRSSSKAP